MTIRTWNVYAETFRRREIEILVSWLRSGSSGSVSGLPGVGTSNLLGYFCNRLDVVHSLLPAGLQFHLIPVDLNNLPDDTPATFYRVILRAFHESRQHLPADLSQLVDHQFQTNKASTDSFLVQSALWEIMWACRRHNLRVVFVFDRFDDFCQTAVPHMSNSLRGLRDKFKDNLMFIMGMGQEVAYLPKPEILGRLYEILDTRVCWVWPMNETDARQMMQQETQATPRKMSSADKAFIYTLSGGYPALIKSICYWWLTHQYHPPYEKWEEALLGITAVQHRLQNICLALNQEELLILKEMHKMTTVYSQMLPQRHRNALNRLYAKGLIQKNGRKLRIRGRLLTRFLTSQANYGRGRLWLDQKTNEIMQDENVISNLSPLEDEVLKFLLKNPRMRHTKSEIIINAWPGNTHREGVTDDSLYQIVGSLRKKIEPVPAKPSYLVTWRGQPEGGYQLYPEGRPR